MNNVGRASSVLTKLSNNKLECMSLIFVRKVRLYDSQASTQSSQGSNKHTNVLVKGVIYIIRVL